MWFGLNGTFLDSGDPGLGLLPHVTLSAADIFGGELIPAGSTETIGTILEFRASAEDFEGTIPNGFRALRVDEWPNPDTLDPTDFFDIIAWQGDGSNPRSFTGLNFQPGLAWVKSTSETQSHILCNSLLGGGINWSNDLALPDDSSLTAGQIAALTSDGITVDENAGNDDNVNDAGAGYIGLFWKEDPGFFDVVGYAGTVAAQTLNHSLGVAPDIMYVRVRDASDESFCFASTLIDAVGEPITDPETDYLEHSTTLALTDSLPTWNDTAPTATQFTVGTRTGVNSDTRDHMAMLWAEVGGLSKFASYAGTGGDNSESPFIYCGFKPKVIWIKELHSIGDWNMLPLDTAVRDATISTRPQGGTGFSGRFRSDSNTNLIQSGAPLAMACGSGFKITTGLGSMNGGSDEYLVMAFAEIPFIVKSAFSVSKTGDGAVDMNFVLEGQGTNPNRHGDGAMDLSFTLTGSGNQGGRRTGDGAMDFKIEIEGQGTNDKRKRGAGAVEPLGIELEGQGRNRRITGGATLPQLTSNGQILQSHAISGTVTNVQLTTNGFMPTSLSLDGSLRLPILTTSGEINPRNDAVLPTFETNGTVLVGTVNRGLFSLPQIQPSGILINTTIATGTARLPLLQVLGTLIQGAAVSAPGIAVGPLGGGMNLPALEANGFLLVPQEMAGTAITLPVIDIGPLSLIAPGSIITGSAILPIQRLDIVLVNGATLAATVWAMNTETLETTNYLNFDFVSLVSFADQPYGVTAGGIFLLEGDDDDGTNIDARILTGISDRGDEALKEASHMYMQYDGGAMMFQLLADGQQRLREYRFERRSNSSGVIHARAKGSRGLRSRAWQMGLRNLGGDDFLLDKLGLLLRILTRNTRKN